VTEIRRLSRERGREGERERGREGEREIKETTDFKNGATEPTERTDPHSIAQHSTRRRPERPAGERTGSRRTRKHL